MKVDKAIFGEGDRGHGLRCFSSNSEFFKNISQSLDLPDAFPSGTGFSSYVSGFASQGNYVVAKTFLDETASRPGMVISYAIAVSIDDIQHLDNIKLLLNLLPDRPVIDREFCNEHSTIELTNGSFQPIITLNDSVAELLVSKKSGPIINIGLVDFDEQVASIWVKLWPSMRSKFSFRLSLSPKDCIEPNVPSLVCIPASLASRWHGDYKVIDQVALSEPPSLGAQAILTGYEQYSDFCRIFGIKLDTPSMLGLMAQAFDIHSYNEQQLNFDIYLSLVRLIEILSPDRTKGVDQKNILISQLANSVPDAHISKILKLRNMSEQEFPSLENLWNAVSSRLMLFQFSSQDDSIMIEIINKSFDEEKSVDAWRHSVHAAFPEIISTQNSTIYSAIWRWLPFNFEVTEQLLELHAFSVDFLEDRLKSNAPNQISEETAAIALSFFAKKKFFLLHALVLAQIYPVNEALLRQLKADRNSSSTQGLAFIVNQSRPDELLAACLSLNNTLITELTIEQAVANPSILKDVSSDAKDSLFIWAKVMARNLNVWNAPQDPQGILFSLLHTLITSGVSTNMPLLKLLSTTPISDLCDFPQRSIVWDLLEGNSRSNYLNMTAVGWYKRALQQEFLELDSKLDKAVSQTPALLERIHQADLANIRITINIFSQVKSLTESDFLIWLEGYIDNINHQNINNMMVVGQLIQDKRWEDSAKLIFDNRHKSLQNMKKILMCCKELLPLWDKLSMGFSNGSQKWQALTELMHELYPYGPEENEIWVRSGGKPEAMLTTGTGLEKWAHAMRHIKSGSKPYPIKLLDKAKRDFSNNENVNILYKLFEN